MRLVLRGLWNQYRPQRRGESLTAYIQRRFPDQPIPPWTDGTF